MYLGFPDSSVGKEYACNAGDPSSIPGLGRSPGERNGCPLQYSGLENSTDCIVHGVAKSWKLDTTEQLSLSQYVSNIYNLVIYSLYMNVNLHLLVALSPYLALLVTPRFFFFFFLMSVSVL